jgi:hypothetical protein
LFNTTRYNAREKSQEENDGRRERGSATPTTLRTLGGAPSPSRIDRARHHHHGRSKTIGPYYQWTFKRSAKTVTVNLSASQRKPFQKAIDTNQSLEALLTQMRELSRKILDATTQGVQRRSKT